MHVHVVCALFVLSLIIMYSVCNNHGTFAKKSMKYVPPNGFFAFRFYKIQFRPGLPSLGRSPKPHIRLGRGYPLSIPTTSTDTGVGPLNPISGSAPGRRACLSCNITSARWLGYCSRSVAIRAGVIENAG